jgi:hypothetical protein
MQHFGVLFVNANNGDDILKVLVVEKVQYNRIDESKAFWIGDSLELCFKFGF